MIREYEVTQLIPPQAVTDSGVTGSWIDTQGLIGHGGREMKFILSVGDGTTKGLAGGSVKSAEDGSGTNSETVVTFTGLSTDGIEEQHGVINAGHRYVQFIGTVASGKDMVVSANLVAVARDH